jgi:uncharacterized membrane protein YphA (DoxX/SURF4 family)
MARLCVGLLSSIWLVAGLVKLQSLQSTADFIEAYLPGLTKLSVLLAIMVICTEIVLGVGLLFSRTRKVTLIGTLVLCSVFFAINLNRAIEGVSAPCSCLGWLLALPPKGSIALNVIQLLLATSSLSFVQGKRQ